MKCLLTFCIIFVCLYASAQVSLVKDIKPGTGLGAPMHNTLYQNKLYFAANDATPGRKLMSCDTTDSVSVVYDFGSTASGLWSETYGYEEFAVANNKLYFTAQSSSASFALLYSYDGTSVSIADNIVEYPEFLTEMDGKVYMSGTTSAYGSELWRYDPISLTIKRCSDINPGSGNSQPVYLTPYNHKLYFAAGNVSTLGVELYVYDPVTDTTTLVKDINPGIASSQPWNLTVYQNKLYFTAKSDSFGTELYSYDGTTVKRLTDLTAGTGDGAKGYDPYYAFMGREVLGYNNAIYFAADTAGDCGLGRYNIATGNVNMIPKVPGGCLVANNMIVYKGKLYYCGEDAAHGNELWIYDGVHSTQLLADIYVGSTPSWPYNSILFNHSFYFRAVDATHKDELWKYYDSTAYVDTTNGGDTTHHTGLQNISFKDELRAYPNPATVTFNIDLNLEDVDRISISVTDVYGKRVYNLIDHDCIAGKNSMKITMAQLPAGVYFYHIVNSTGKLYYSGKVLKE